MQIKWSNKFWIIGILVWVLILALFVLFPQNVSDSSSDKANDNPASDVLLSNKEAGYYQKLDEYMHDFFSEYEVLSASEIDGKDIYIVESEDAFHIVGFIYQAGDILSQLHVTLRNVEFETEYYVWLYGIKKNVKIMITSNESKSYKNAMLNQKVSIGENKYYLCIDELSPAEMKYARFHNFVLNNTYDKWLKIKEEEGILPVREMYGEYLKYWYSEFEFTLECAKELFKNEDEYFSWKAENEEWLKTTKELLKKEVNNFTDEMHRLEVIIPYSELVRQKVIDTKYFLYILESNTTEEITNYISLKWKGWK